MSNTEAKKKSKIQADTKCCRTCHYVRPIKKVLWGCSHPSAVIYTKNRGLQILKTKMDSVCNYWEPNPMLAGFHKESE